MLSNSTKTAFVVTAFASLASPSYLDDANAVVMVSESSMPQFVPDELYPTAGEKQVDTDDESIPSAVSIYHYLRKEFGISHTEMSGWLGVKRRTLYNWMSDPERSSKFGPIIEARLASLYRFNEEMEPLHRPILFKIAFSPIYGDPALGEAILSGASREVLIDWYDRLFSQFESYRSLQSSNDKLV